MSERAELLRVVLDHAERDSRYVMAVRVFLRPLLAVPASPELVWFAEPAGRALYAAGRYDAAGKRWLAAETAPDLAAAAPGWVELGARVVGGCCRTGPGEIRALRQRLLAG